MERTARELRTLVDRLAAAAVGTDLEDAANRAAILAATLESDVTVIVATYERVVRPVLYSSDPARHAAPLVLVNPPGTRSGRSGAIIRRTASRNGGLSHRR